MSKVATEQDQARFRQVVLPYLTDCYGLARWLTGDRADAEDVVQEACLQALRSIHSFAGINARAWTLTIVRHTAYRWLRKNRSAALIMVDDLEAVERAQADCGTSESGSDGNPEAALIAKSRQRRALSARSPSFQFHSARRWCCATCKASITARSRKSPACRSAPSCRDLRALAIV